MHTCEINRTGVFNTGPLLFYAFLLSQRIIREPEPPVEKFVYAGWR